MDSGGHDGIWHHPNWQQQNEGSESQSHSGYVPATSLDPSYLTQPGSLKSNAGMSWPHNSFAPYPVSGQWSSQPLHDGSHGQPAWHKAQPDFFSVWDAPSPSPNPALKQEMLALYLQDLEQTAAHRTNSAVWRQG